MAVQTTEAEWKILEVLWDSAPRAMSEITRILQPETAWTRHVVITLLKRMQDKGSVLVDESGPVKMYFPKITREEASASQTRKFLSSVFKGRPSLLINSLVDSGEMSLEEIQDLLNLLKGDKKA